MSLLVCCGVVCGCVYVSVCGGVVVLVCWFVVVWCMDVFMCRVVVVWWCGVVGLLVCGGAGWKEHPTRRPLGRVGGLYDHNFQIIVS